MATMDPTLGELFVLTLLRAQVAATVAILAVAGLRDPVRRLAGPGVAYRLWGLVPAAGISSLFPTLAEFMGRDNLLGLAPIQASDPLMRALSDDGFWSGWAQGLTWVWLAGGLGLALLFLRAELAFRRLAGLGLAGPAIVGVASPRLVVPWDYKVRFTQIERGFIRRHERAHMQRRDNLANLLITGVQVLGWFNPLIHLAASAARLDQEAACDAQVLDGRPRERRAYAEALLKAHCSGPNSGLVSAWSASSGRVGKRHPLEWRLSLLARPEPSLRRYVAGVALVGTLAVTMSAAVWTLAPRRQGAQVGFHRLPIRELVVLFCRSRR